MLPITLAEMSRWVFTCSQTIIYVVKGVIYGKLCKTTDVVNTSNYWEVMYDLSIEPFSMALSDFRGH